jgi:alkaline phosphatase
MIGDGMGLSQVTASMYAQRNRTIFERFPTTGLIATHSHNHLVTDSGAGATAFACGCKTYNGAIGVDHKKHPCKTLLEIADSLGMATGLTVSCSVTHATPASFAAHVSSRQDMEDIAEWYLVNQVDYLVGGGSKYFQERKKEPGRNLLNELRQKGYAVHTQRYDTLPPAPAGAQPYCWLTAREEPPPATQGRRYLPESVRRGCDYLQQKGGAKGFFMMVEGSQIDWAGHANDRDRLLAEMLDFEQAIEAALAFAAKDGNTLVLVTADHETGGMSMLQGSNLDSLDMKFTTKSHTASLIPVFAYGPGAEHFGGLYENTDIFFKIKKAIGWQ